MLRPVFHQFSLFSFPKTAIPSRAFASAYSRSMSDKERDSRTGPQWLRAIRAYCEFGTGDAWRRLGDGGQRSAPERLWYLSGLRLINSILAGAQAQEAPRPQLVNTRPADDLLLAEIARLPRAELVDGLMKLDSSLTDRKLLSRLQRPKLARMILDARKFWTAELERTA